MKTIKTLTVQVTELRQCLRGMFLHLFLVPDTKIVSFGNFGYLIKKEHMQVSISKENMFNFVAPFLLASTVCFDIKVDKGAKIRNRYNQEPHLTQDTNGKVTNSQ